MDIYLVRHGEAAASWGESADPGLSEQGRRQAESVADALAPRLHGGASLLSSPLARARETAVPLARRLALPVLEHEAFREVPSPVPLAGRQAWLKQFMRERWESQDEVLHTWRDAAIKGLQELSPPAVVFTHFLVINAVVGVLLGRAETLCFWPDNGSITHLRVGSSGLELVALGDEMPTAVT